MNSKEKLNAASLKVQPGFDFKSRRSYFSRCAKRNRFTDLRIIIYCLHSNLRNYPVKFKRIAELSAVFNVCVQNFLGDDPFKGCELRIREISIYPENFFLKLFKRLKLKIRSCFILADFNQGYSNAIR